MLRALRRGWRRPGLLNYAAYPLSLGYAGAMRARGFAYARGWMRSHAVSAKVIVVGNLSVGGAGKTPLVMALVHACKTRGMRPGVIARGYRSDSLMTREVTAKMSAREAGDEPLLIFRKCNAPVAVGRNRVQCAQLLIEKHNCGIIISDDGFQHHALQRDLDIVVIDGERGLGNRWCLPAGPLREAAGALARADLIAVNGDKAGDGEFALHPRIENAVRIGGGGDSMRALKSFAGGKVHAVAGTGNPRRFFRQLRAHGIEVTPHAFPDHHRFCANDLNFARGENVLLTEKDAVKVTPLLTAESGVTFWRVPLQLSPPPEFFREVFSRIDAGKK